ncbi:hypothetical protein ISR94_03280 [Candidatus Microgenomates bacterium]|nr:hypothetical protein [Candidatus Microgenomates bacterium]
MDPAKEEKVQEEVKKVEPQAQQPSTLKEKETDLLVWTAPARPFKRRDRQFYVTTISIASLVSLILFLAEGAMPVILIISLIFLYYVLSTVEPETIEYKITNKGIKIANKITPWEQMGRFWFGKRYSSELLILETFVLPGRMELVVDLAQKEQIKKVLASYLTEEEISPSRLDRAVEWFSKKMPQ